MYGGWRTQMQFLDHVHMEQDKYGKFVTFALSRRTTNDARANATLGDGNGLPACYAHLIPEKGKGQLTRSHRMPWPDFQRSYSLHESQGLQSTN